MARLLTEPSAERSPHLPAPLPYLQELLGLLARSCLLPGRVVELVAARPDVLVAVAPSPLAEQVAHLKGETTPMGSQVACLWQKFPEVQPSPLPSDDST